MAEPQPLNPNVNKMRRSAGSRKGLVDLGLLHVCDVGGEYRRVQGLGLRSRANLKVESTDGKAAGAETTSGTARERPDRAIPN